MAARPGSRPSRLRVTNTKIPLLQHKLCIRGIPETSTLQSLLLRRADYLINYAFDNQVDGRACMLGATTNSSIPCRETTPMYRCFETYAVDPTLDNTAQHTFQPNAALSGKLRPINLRRSWSHTRPTPLERCCLFPTNSPPTQKMPT